MEYYRNSGAIGLIILLLFKTKLKKLLHLKPSAVQYLGSFCLASFVIPTWYHAAVGCTVSVGRK